MSERVAMLAAIDSLVENIENTLRTENAHVRSALEHLHKARSDLECIYLIML